MNWRDAAPLAGLGILAVTGLYYLLRPKRENPGELERQRRAYLNRVGRIVEGQVLDVVDDAATSQLGSADSARAPLSASSRAEEHGSLRGKGHAASSTDGIPRLLHYTYSISGVTYETAQDITGLEERLHLTRVAAGQTASVKYDPSNPSNSILLADDWSGLH
ncbi:MAG TPA: hypothetical protein VNE63_19050 [Candidatus Acidoferrales bacterium]|nr:hypothetical protein [Candidatus Acidoferrales bacterium]